MVITNIAKGRKATAGGGEKLELISDSMPIPRIAEPQQPPKLLRSVARLIAWQRVIKTSVRIRFNDSVFLTAAAAAQYSVSSPGGLACCKNKLFLIIVQRIYYYALSNLWVYFKVGSEMLTILVHTLVKLMVL